MKKITLLVAIALPFGTSACSPTPAPGEQAPVASNQPFTRSNAAQPNGYIVTARDAAAVRRAYAKYGIVLLRPLGNGLFELHLQTDPGLAEITDLATHSNGTITAVQPNFSYQTN